MLAADVSSYLDTHDCVAAALSLHKRKPRNMSIASTSLSRNTPPDSKQLPACWMQPTYKGVWPQALNDPAKRVMQADDRSYQDSVLVLLDPNRSAEKLSFVCVTVLKQEAEKKMEELRNCLHAAQISIGS